MDNGEGRRAEEQGMKLSTHLAFGVGVAGLLASLAECDIVCWMLALIISLSINLVIDLIGHRARLFHPPVRTKITHSLPGIIAISMLVTFIASRGLLLADSNPLFLYGIGLASGLSHWLLDALNPSGVYLFRRKFRLAKIPYYSFVANMVFQMIGGAMLLYSILILPR
ncbi:MAG: metal-dependent hydrolase [Desulfurococcales archaeon]|nr:metal-dependent hydrolase [Desulfurococcales archaeon]MCE4626070.1 metal-dependent hydrolase [Desulfurococcales archaeon]